MPTLVLNEENIEKHRAGRTVKAYAQDIGVDAATMSRLLSGKSEPGPKVIAGFLTAFPYPFDHFFRVTEDA